FERERICRFEIVDRSPTGHILVDEIVFSSSEKPPVSEADVVTPPPANERAAALLEEKARLEGQVPGSEFAMVAEDHEPQNVKLHIRGNHKNLGQEVQR